jgi:STE24 endopeptidase
VSRFDVVTHDGQDLRQALIKLCESNQAMPLAHPLFSLVYYSHPPLLERIAALKTSRS